MGATGKVLQLGAEAALGAGKQFFKKMKAAVEEGNWEEAANQMHDSKWREQVPNRAKRLINRMKKVEVS